MITYTKEEFSYAIINMKGFAMEKKKRPTDFRVDVTKTIAVERMMQQMSQEELANRVGTKKSNISRIESGRQNITLDYVEALSLALGKEISFVMEEPGIDYGDDTEYSFKLYDEELMRFRLTRKIDLHCEITYINEERKHLLPLEMVVTGEGVREWLRKRVIPQNRELVWEILDALGLEISDLKGIIDVCKGLSLNDSYWVTPVSFEGYFIDYNLYQNRFSETLSLIAYKIGRAHV